MPEQQCNKKPRRGRPPKLKPETIQRVIVLNSRTLAPGIRQTTRSDRELADMIKDRTGVEVSEELVRRHRIAMGIRPYVEPGSGRPGARDRKPRVRRSLDPTKRVYRRLTISDEALARWTQRAYRWDPDRRKYAYRSELGARPRGMRATLPPWGVGLGLP